MLVIIFLGAASKFVGPAIRTTSSSVAHKYLQVALVVDENVAARHGNQTADFLLVLANIVSSVLTVVESILCCSCSNSFEISLLHITTLYYKLTTLFFKNV